MIKNYYIYEIIIIKDNKKMFDDDDGVAMPHIVIDNGSRYIQAGFSSEDGPRVVISSCVGHPKYSSNTNFFFGNDGEYRNRPFKLNYPNDRGYINDWDEMEKIWNHIFTNELKVSSEEQNVLLTGYLKYPKETREKIAQTMFEKFNVPGLYIANPGVLAIYCAGKFDGIAIDLGEGGSRFIPIFDVFSLSHAEIYQNFGGKDLTEYMAILLNNSGYRFKFSTDREIIEKIKKEICYVAFDYEEELKSVKNINYRLPDDKVIIAKDQRIKCPEVLFKPGIYNIGQACYDSIQKCDIDIRKDLYHNIVLSGGTSLFNGLPQRFEKEIKNLAPESMKEEVRVIASPERRFASWIGGSILSSISEFENIFIEKYEYEEQGATIVHRKCF